MLVLPRSRIHTLRVHFWPLTVVKQVSGKLISSNYPNLYVREIKQKHLAGIDCTLADSILTL